MTWHTNLGMRVLEGVEAEVYLTAVQSAIDYIELMDDGEGELDVRTGDHIFDFANPGQKIVILHVCLSALLKPEVEAPNLNNVPEAGAYFPFAYLQMRVEEEISEEDDWHEDEAAIKYYFRRLIWRAFEEFVRPRWRDAVTEDGKREEEAEFSERSTNLNLWEEIIDELADRIFWDRDWQMSTTFAVSAGQRTPRPLDGIETEFSQATDLEEDYITNRLPKVSDAEVAAALAEIRAWKLP